MKIVIDTESDEPELLGTYMSVEEDTVLYFASSASDDIHSAPADCVAIVDLTDWIGHLPNAKKGG